MIIMGLDTTGPQVSVSIVDETRVLAHSAQDMVRGQAEALAPMVEAVLKKANLSPHHIDKLAVCTGPGSFTGLRVALSFAKGFALPRKTPIIGIDALEVTAQTVLYRHNDALIGVMRDVRRNQVFYASYSHGYPLEAPRAVSLEIAQSEVNILQAGLYEAGHIDTRILAWLAAERSPDDYPAQPLYARGPDAKLPSRKPKAAAQFKTKRAL